jgi:hypothetical protein
VGKDLVGDRSDVSLSKHFCDGLCNTAVQFDAFLSQPEDDLKSSHRPSQFFEIVG